MDLNNKVAVVTGASKGIGLALVELLLEAGCSVVGISRKAPDLVHEKFHFLEADVRDEKRIEDVFVEIKNRIGDIDILINNAGLGFFKLMEDLSTEEWNQMMETNVNAIFYTTKQILKDWKKKNSGHIINISSVAGLTGIPEATGYAATKFAVRGLTLSLQRELKDTLVKTTCVYPGSVNTDFFTHYDGVNSNPTMLSPYDIASTILHVLRMPENATITEVEVRPQRVSYK